MSSSTLVTCSLDKTIKFWDLSRLADSQSKRSGAATDSIFHASHTVDTTYPVWRARNTPFGKGVLALPQRGETRLELWGFAESSGESEDAECVIRFEGHRDIVKEYVWRVRSGGSVGDEEYQLITWSKDRTLRLWPIRRDIIDVSLCDV